MITALGGGVGAAKFLEGLTKLVPNEELTLIINTADDIELYGFNISPDIDTIIYRLSGNIDTEKGWGLKGDTQNVLNSLSSFGIETWFGLGDRDFATQIFKKKLSLKGNSKTGITKLTASKFGLGNLNILPMSDEPVETWIETTEGEMHFQDYYIKRRMVPEVTGLKLRGIEDAKPSPGVLDAISNSDLIIICPSNPIISIGPILEVSGIREAVVSSPAKVVAISPLIGGKPLKGPADKLMKGLGLEASSSEIAKLYKDFLDVMVLDDSDSGEVRNINSLDISTFVTDTIMTDDGKSETLSRRILDFLDI